MPVLKPEDPTNGDCLSLLEIAQGVVKERRKKYGEPYSNMALTAKVWSGILATEVTPQQVAMCMIGLKLVRESHQPQMDNRIDMAGYVDVLDRCEQLRK